MMRKWTRPQILNPAHELSCFMVHLGLAHLKEKLCIMKYCVGKPNHGLFLKPNMKWDGDPSFEFKIKGKADSDFAKDPERCRSVSGGLISLCNALVTPKS